MEDVLFSCPSIWLPLIIRTWVLSLQDWRQSFGIDALVVVIIPSKSWRGCLLFSLLGSWSSRCWAMASHSWFLVSSQQLIRESCQRGEWNASVWTKVASSRTMYQQCTFFHTGNVIWTGCASASPLPEVTLFSLFSLNGDHFPSFFIDYFLGSVLRTWDSWGASLPSTKLWDSSSKPHTGFGPWIRLTNPIMHSTVAWNPGSEENLLN
jgi:hypothetical protein